jgi:hypothetical protein
LVVLSLLFLACGDDDSASMPAAGSGGSGGSGGSSAGSSARGGSSGGGSSEIGAACAKDADCGTGMFCDREIAQKASIPGAPSGASTIDQSLFPGGSCTPTPISVYDPNGMTSCDPGEPIGAQKCGSDGVCSVELVMGDQMVACRKACEPSATESGCDREGYTCDFVNHDCIEGCRSDTECRLTVVESADGSGTDVSYDASSTSTCDTETGRCTHPSGSKQIGEACDRSEDCSGEEGLCIPPDAAPAGLSFPGGACTRTGCDVKGLECGDGSVCESLRPWLDGSQTERLCLTRCTVGAEPEAQRLGKSGHGEGCREGYRCHYNGGAGAKSGVCAGGVYNDVKTNNIGATCKTNDDCYSPFGLGYCLVYGLPNGMAATGVCTLMDCGAPGLPSDVCGAGNVCVGQQGDQSFCQHMCKAADECPDGFGCTDDDMDPSTPKTCYPLCAANGDCRTGEQCKPLSTAMGSAGLCTK